MFDRLSSISFFLPKKREIFMYCLILWVCCFFFFGILNYVKYYCLLFLFFHLELKNYFFRPSRFLVNVVTLHLLFIITLDTKLRFEIQSFSFSSKNFCDFHFYQQIIQNVYLIFEIFGLVFYVYYLFVIDFSNFILP